MTDTMPKPGRNRPPRAMKSPLPLWRKRGGARPLWWKMQVSCRLDFSLDKEREHLNEAVRLHTEVTGSRPLGWYLGRCSINTRQLVMQEGGFLYDADSY